MRFGRAFLTFLISAAGFFSQGASAASYSLVPSDGTRASGSGRTDLGAFASEYAA